MTRRTLTLIATSLFVLGFLALLCGCAIPVVGNSPEELKHRQYLKGPEQP